MEGKGLGLYLAKTQITPLGGRIDVESEIDKGSTFKVFFKY
jgi:signal transduction histidine kinase